MPIRDLQYPADAERTIDSLLAGLRYDAAVTVGGNALKSASLPEDSPDVSTGIRFGGRAEDQAVRREAPALLSRFALIQMVSRVEVEAQDLLLQRRVLEELGASGKKMVPKKMWAILKRIHEESKKGPVRLCSELVVTQPSPALLGRMKWLDGIYCVRNCLAHRLGRVQLIDAKPPGKSIDEMADDDTFKVVWLKPEFSIDGKPFTPGHVYAGGGMKMTMSEHPREWKVGEVIHVTPEDCQAIAMSLSMLATELLRGFVKEMNALLNIDPPERPAAPPIDPKGPASPPN